MGAGEPPFLLHQQAGDLRVPHNDTTPEFVCFETQRVDQLLEEVGPGELPFQLHYQAQDLRALLAACMAQPDKKLAVMRDRVRKHLSATPPLCEEVWRRCGILALKPNDEISMASSYSQPDKKLAVMRERVREHLAGPPPLCEQVCCRCVLCVRDCGSNCRFSGARRIARCCWSLR